MDTGEMDKVLITGGSGFIGSHLAEKLLKSGFAVVNLDNMNNYYDPEIKEKNIAKALAHNNYQFIQGDILDQDLLENITKENSFTYAVHLAAMAGVRNSLADPALYVDVDIKGTVNILEVFKNRPLKRLLFASSSSVYGENKKVPFAEDDTVDNQISPYAAAKTCGELYCKTYHRLYNISIGCMRFFTVYGPRQRPDMAIYKFIKCINEDKPIPVFGDGRSLRDYTYVDDIINGLISAMRTPYKFEIFNLGNNQTIALNELIKLLEKLFNKNINTEALPFQRGDVLVTCADIQKPQKLLSYKPTVTIEEGIRKTLEWYKNQYQI